MMEMENSSSYCDILSLILPIITVSAVFWCAVLCDTALDRRVRCHIQMFWEANERWYFLMEARWMLEALDVWADNLVKERIEP